MMQAADPVTFDTKVEQWLNSLPHDSFAALGILPLPNQVLLRPGYGHNYVRIQRDVFLATSGTVASKLDTVRFSIRAPPNLFLAAHQPMLSTWVPISYWGNVATWTVIDALQYAARSLLRPYDPQETLSGQMFVEILVNSQIQELRRLMDAMPIAVWDLQATPLPPHAPPSLRWSSNQDPGYDGPVGELYHHRTPGTDQEVFTFVTQSPARLVFQSTLDAIDTLLDPIQLHDLMKDMAYIN